MTVREYAEHWRTIQAHRPTTVLHVETMLRRHLYPVLGDRLLGEVLPSGVQALVKRMSLALQPSTVRVVHRYVASIFTAAVKDRRIPVSPCGDTRLPRVDRRRIQPLATDVVWQLAAAMPSRYAALVVVAAGTGMRQGEIFGLTVDRVDFLRRRLQVDRQLLLIPGREPFLAPPKTPTSVRTIPLPDVVLEALSQHLRAFPAGAGDLLFTSEESNPLRRTRFSERVWRPAVAASAAPAPEPVTCGDVSAAHRPFDSRVSLHAGHRRRPPPGR